MVSAHAIRPPDYPFRSAGFRAFGRRFIERALVLSALVHLMAAGLFRAAERNGARRGEQQITGIPEQAHTFNLLVPLQPPPAGRSSGSASARVGVIDPVPPRRPDFPLSEFGVPWEAKPIGPEGEPGRDEGPPPTPPPAATPAFAGVDTPPALKYAPKPVYPEWAREAGVEGKVLLRVLVGKDGRPKKVIATGGVRALGEDAARAVMRWTFHPALSNGNPIEVWVEVPVVFRL